MVDPIEPFPDRGREGAIVADGDLVPQGDVRNKHGEKLDGCDELVVASQARVELCSLIVDHAVVSVGETLERDRWAFDVLQERFQRLSLARLLRR